MYCIYKYPPGPPKWMYTVIHLPFGAFLLIWFLAGNYFVFRHWQPDYEPTEENDGLYCNRVLYNFAFTVMIIYYGLACLLICCPVCLLYFSFVALTEAKVANTTGCLGGEDEAEPPDYPIPFTPKDTAPNTAKTVRTIATPSVKNVASAKSRAASQSGKSVGWDHELDGVGADVYDSDISYCTEDDDDGGTSLDDHPNVPTGETAVDIAEAGAGRPNTRPKTRKQRPSATTANRPKTRPVTRPRSRPRTNPKSGHSAHRSNASTTSNTSAVSYISELPPIPGMTKKSNKPNSS